ncbi:putative membrane protein [compost metagenome]
MSRLSPLDRLWLCEAIRLREEQAGPLDDDEANRRARAAGGDLAERIQTRAVLLAERDGQRAGLRHWHQGARLALLVLLVAALLGGAGLAFAALGDGVRAVNVFWALGSLLGLHLLTLLGWALAFGFAGGGGALGRLWLWLSGKLARDVQVAQLAPALLLVLERRRLSRWALGALVHGLWLLALLSAAAMLLALLATRRYGFVWETTILAGDTFVALTRALGALPALLGFAIPDAETIRASGDSALASEAARRLWSSWLLGVLLVYGLLPRLALLGLCLWRWRQGLARLRLDLEQPAYRLLGERLQPSSERLGVLDAAPAQLAEPAAGTALAAGSGALLVAIELDERRAWPPKLAAGIADAGVLDSREQRQRLLDQLSRFPPARLAIACDPRRSPDRGTLALLGELARSAASARVWLIAPPPGEALDSARLGDWHAALEKLGLAWNDSSPLTWLETGHD